MEAGENKNDYYWKILQRQVQEKRIEEVFGIFESECVEAILIKGWAAARNYPQPSERLSADIDAAVRPESFARCEKLLRERKITGVDLHKGLRHLDTLDWSDLYRAAETLEIGGAPVKIPRAEDHLRILCVHWLGDGGADKERLRDIYYAVENRPADFDWDRCLNAAGARRRKWILCAIGLAEKYLGLDARDTPAAEQSKELPRWLIETVEKEWKRNVRLKPLYACLRDGGELLEQLNLRFPPNAIQASVEMEAEFDERARMPYQIGSLAARIRPSLVRIVRALRAGERVK